MAGDVYNFRGRYWGHVYPDETVVSAYSRRVGRVNASGEIFDPDGRHLAEIHYGYVVTADGVYLDPILAGNTIVDAYNEILGDVRWTDPLAKRLRTDSWKTLTDDGALDERHPLFPLLLETWWQGGEPEDTLDLLASGAGWLLLHQQGTSVFSDPLTIPTTCGGVEDLYGDRVGWVTVNGLVVAADNRPVGRIDPRGAIFLCPWDCQSCSVVDDCADADLPHYRVGDDPPPAPEPAAPGNDGVAQVQADGAIRDALNQTVGRVLPGGDIRDRYGDYVGHVDTMSTELAGGAALLLLLWT